MATIMTQTDKNKGGISLVSTTLAGATQDIKSFNQAGVTKSVASGGTPDGELTAGIGSEHTDLTNVKRYINTDASTAWSEFVQSESLESTPTEAGIILNQGSKSYMSAYHALSVTGTPYIMSHTITSGQEVTAIAPATETTPQIVGVPVTGGTVGLQWFQTRGQIEALVDGTADVAAADFIQILNTGVAFVVDAAAIDVTSSAQAVDAQAADSAVSVTIILLGNTSTVAAT